AQALTDQWVDTAGVSGNRCVDLQARRHYDVRVHAPAVLSIKTGIRDTWRRYDSDDPTSVEQFESGYRDLVTQARDAGVGRIMLVEPFLLPVRPDQWDWREDLYPKIQSVRRIVLDLCTDYLATHGPTTQRSTL